MTVFMQLRTANTLVTELLGVVFYIYLFIKKLIYQRPIFLVVVI